MPGFVDVTGWSKEDIRRLGHADDADDTYTYTRKPYSLPKPLKQKVMFTYESDKVWGAAVVAFRANKGYVKALAPGLHTKTNRQIVDELLKDNVPLLNSDIEEGRKVRQYFKALTFKIIEGKTLTPFLQNAMQIAEKDTITDSLGVGTIASLPATYTKMTERDSVENRMKWARGGFVGLVGDKTTEKIVLIKRLWSQNYMTWYYTGINDKDQVLFFAHKKELEIGSYVTIEGKVKSHRENSTQLSHVKVI